LNHFTVPVATSALQFESYGGNIVRQPGTLQEKPASRILVRRVDGIFLSDFEKGEIGPDLFRHACLMGLEGLVSKHGERPYRAGPSRHWIKVKNPKVAGNEPDEGRLLASCASAKV